MPGLDTPKYFVHIALPVPIDMLFTYASYDQKPIPGQVVRVPFGKRQLWGVVWEYADLHPHAKAIATYHPFLHISETLRSFLTKMSRYLLCPLGSVLKMTLPHLAYEDSVFLEKNDNDICTKIKGRAIDALRMTTNHRGLASQWSEWTGAISNQMHTWCKKKWLMPSENQSIHHLTAPSNHQKLDLSPEQTKAARKIKSAWEHQPVLLEGLTGSGKTEVLLSLCPAIWKKGQQVLVLLPEIALIHQWVNRIQQYFNGNVSIWHSGLSSKERQVHFDKIISGSAHIIVGARSALFLPYPFLGMIIVDEEHESSYKQTETVLYHGRDMAIWRAHTEHIPVILSSATPSMESRWNVSQKRYAHVLLNQRFGHAQLPTFQCVDMRAHPPRPGHWISPDLKEKIALTLDKKEQTLLFLNRRGYAQIMLCFRCQFRAQCPHCAVCLGVHEQPQRLLCHYCGYEEPVHQTCPGCGQSNALIMRGPGVEQIQEEVHHLFPNARTMILSSDHMKSSNALNQALRQITNREVDIIIGTQISAKGHHFPFLTCIGIIDSDFVLENIDFRSGERLFQLLYQVAGRAGRSELPGHVYLQTMIPEHSLLQSLARYDWQQFVCNELTQRALNQMPPETRMVCMTLSDTCPWRTEESALRLYKSAPHHKEITLLGPAPALITPLRNRHRWHILIKAPRKVPIQCFLEQWIKQADICKRTRLDIDRDPYHFL
jgi:primosomal protein N' (replication factor Y)